MGSIWSSEERKKTDAKFTDITRRFTDIELQLRSIQTEQSEADKRVNDLAAKLEATNKKVDDLVTAMTSTNERVDDLVTVMTSTNERVDDLVTVMTSTNERVNDLTTELKTTNEGIKDSRTEMKTSNSSILKMVQRIEKRRRTQFPGAVEEWLGQMYFSLLNIQLNDNGMSQISKCINPQSIRQVGLMLNLRDNDIRTIQHDYKDNAAEQAYRVIIKWQNKMGKKGNMKNLLDALFEADREYPDSINVEELQRALKTIKKSDNTFKSISLDLMNLSC